MQRVVCWIVLSMVFCSTAFCQETMNPITCYETHRIHCLNLVSNENKVCNDKTCELANSNGQWVIVCVENTATRTPNHSVSRAVPVQDRWALDNQTSNLPTVCTIEQTCTCVTSLGLPQACGMTQEKYIADTDSNEATGEPCFDKKD